jgi:hypothetical protein
MTATASRFSDTIETGHEPPNTVTFSEQNDSSWALREEGREFNAQPLHSVEV